MALIVVIALAGAVLALVLVKSWSWTPPIPGGIAALTVARVGGTEQHLLVRGESAGNPILLYLHGGPGTTELVPFRLSHRRLEKHFTVVGWEQRGTGKSFSPGLPAGSLTIRRLTSDAIELAEYLRREYRKEKILLVGHSWGTMLGILAAQERPDLFYAFVGSGQEVCPAEGERIGYEYVLSRAKNDPAAERELSRLDEGGRYPASSTAGRWFDKVKIQRQWLAAFGGEIYGRADYSLLFNFQTLTAPEYTWLDFINFGRGSVFSLRAMWPEVLARDLRQEAPRLAVPVFFFQGRHDYNTPAALAEEYFRLLEAPAKEMCWFENSAHHPMYEEAEKYDRLLIEKVLPLCRP